MLVPLAAAVEDARRRTLALAAGLAPDQLLGPRLAIVNPPLWELGHVAWFQERWILRRAGAPSWLPDADALYDSSAIPHDDRWTLPLPSLERTLGYLGEVAARVAAAIAAGDADPYFVELSVHHEGMHFEAMCFGRQTLGYPAPAVTRGAPVPDGGGDLPGDVRVPGGTIGIGASPGEAFVFDNEKWRHEVEVAPFAIARAPVTQAAFAAFVDDGGYLRPSLWSDEGWRWRVATGAEWPIYWSRRDGRWMRREFDAWVALEPHRPVVNVSRHEAEAWCRWAGRRLPTEVEWETAAGGQRFPWGDAPPSAGCAHTDARALHAVDVGALASSDAATGCRQLIGNVWEWTASPFLPYPGFTPDPYRDYSQPWFGSHAVLRGGSFATPSTLVRSVFRNFYTPDRRDMWAGFRTCAP